MAEQLPDDLEDLPDDLEDLDTAAVPDIDLSAPPSMPGPPAQVRGPGAGERARAGLVGFATGGIPGAMLGATQGPETAEDLMDAGAPRAAALGVSQGGTLGYADEVGGLIARFLAQGVPATLGGAFQPMADDSPDAAAVKAQALAMPQPSDYELVRNRMRGEAASSAQADPFAFGGGQLGGAIGASVLARRMPGLRGTGAGGAALQGAIEGAVGGLGSSDADLLAGDLVGAQADTARGGVLGAAGGAGGEYLGRGLSAFGAWAGRRAGNALSQGSESLEEGLRRWAQERALKAAGYIQSDFPDRIDDALPKGAALLDEPGLMRPGNSVAELREKLDAVVKSEGQKIGGYLDAADATAANPGLDYAPAEFNPYSLARRVEQNVVRPASYDPSLKPQADRVQSWVNDLLAGNVARTGDGVPSTFRAANDMKGNLQDLVYSARSGEVPLSKQLQEQVQREMIREIDDQATPLLGPEGVAGFQNARRRFGTFTDVLEKAQRGERREVGNQVLGLGDRVQGAAAQAVDPTGGVATGFLSKFVRGRADSAAAVGANALSRNLPAITPEAMAAAGAAVGAGLGRVAGAELQDWLREVLASDPDAAARWAGALSVAASEGPEALAATHYDLAQQDPDYQARLRRAGGQQP